MSTVYIYVLDTLADWEMGHIVAELNSGRYFKKNGQRITLKTVSYSEHPISTMGGMTIVPDCRIEDIAVDETSTLLLPGADTWSNPEHRPIIEKASELLSQGATVCAIRGATVALADFGLLDERRHTSNGPGFLEMFAPGYKGQGFYADEPSVVDGNLVTAGCTGSLLWAKQIIERMDVFRSDTLESWYAYFSTGKAEHFYALMQAASSGDEG